VSVTAYNVFLSLSGLVYFDYQHRRGYIYCYCLCNIILSDYFRLYDECGAYCLRMQEFVLLVVSKYTVCREASSF